MKQPRQKPHLATSHEPLREGSRIEGMCGAVVEGARWAMEFDSLVMGASLQQFVLSLRGLCLACRKKASEQELQRYLYGIAQRLGDLGLDSEAGQ